MIRAGMLTSGGDCQALNPVLRGIARGLYSFCGEEQVELIGFLDGYRGLMDANCRRLIPGDFSDLLTRGGTILGTSRQPFKRIREPDEQGRDKVAVMKATYEALELDGLFVLGGNGSLKTANLLCQEGLRVIGLPKTIDNDIWGTDYTFGFQSAVDVAARALERIRTTAASHSRCFLVELMGHKAGWLTLCAGIAGGADVILIPELPYRLESVAETVRALDGHAVIAVAEGALSAGEAAMPKQEFQQRRKALLKRFPSPTYALAEALSAQTGVECRVVVPGHIQRGGAPAPWDRVLASRMGAYAAGLFHRGEFGLMPALRGGEIVAVSLSEVAGRLKTVPKDCDLLVEARLLGIRFGDQARTASAGKLPAGLSRSDNQN